MKLSVSLARNMTLKNCTEIKISCSNRQDRKLSNICAAGTKTKPNKSLTKTALKKKGQCLKMSSISKEFSLRATMTTWKP